MPDFLPLAGSDVDPDDSALLRATGEGDRRAFALLAQRHTGRMVRLAWRYAGGLALAEDIVQEALVRIWTRAAQWDAARGSPRSWMDRIVVNLCIDQGRRAMPTTDIDALEERIDAAPDPHDHFSGVQLEHAIRDAIDGLPDRQRAALALCFGQDTDCAQGAAILGISISAMESLLQRGRRSIRRRLVELGFLEER